VVPRPGGGALVVWEGDLVSGIDPSIGGRRFDASGNPEADEFQVNSNGTIEQRTPVAAVDQAGRIGVVFQVGSLSFPTKMNARVSNSMGTFLEPDFGIIEVSNPYSLALPDIGASAQSEFVAIWQGFNLNTVEIVIQGRRVLASGTPAPTLDEFIVATADGNANEIVLAPSIAVDPSGNFVVAWIASDIVGPDFDKILGRKYDANNDPVGDAFQIDTDTTAVLELQKTSIACDPSGNFVVAWSAQSLVEVPNEGSEGPASGFDIRVRRFDASANPLGNDFVVNDFLPGNQNLPDIAMRDDGEFVVAWTGNMSGGNDNSGQSIQARLFTADGTPMGADVQVNAFTTGDQTRPAIAALEGGDYLAAWQGASSDDTLGIAGRRLGLQILEEIFADGFESAP
jgi:hypothetical protein